MSQNLTKSIKQKEPEFPEKRRLQDLPESKSKERPIKLIKAKNPRNNDRTRAGNLWPLSPKEKPKIIKNGKRLR